MKFSLAKFSVVLRIFCQVLLMVDKNIYILPYRFGLERTAGFEHFFVANATPIFIYYFTDWY
jgi:hypothetical protein